MQCDLSVLHDTWVNLHPGLYRFITPQQLDSAFASTKVYCSTARNEREFYLQIAQLATLLKCGHSYLNPLNMEDSVAKRILPQQVVPFLFRINAQKQVICTHNLSESKLDSNCRITHFNGIPTENIITNLLKYSRSDGRNGLAKQLNNLSESADEMMRYSAFDIFFPLTVANSESSVQLTYQLPNGSSQTETVRCITRDERLRRFEKTYGILPSGPETWKFFYIGKDAALLSFGTFALWGSNFDGNAWIDSVFKNYILKPEIKYLYIDIRENEGGDNTGDYLLSYLTPRPLGAADPDHPCYRYLRIPDSLQKHLSTWDRSFRLPKDSSLFFKNELGLWELKSAGSADYIFPKPTIFTGKTTLLISAKNSSATFELARNFKNAGLGELVGEATSGCQQGINGGEFFFLTLPESGIEVDIPLIFNWHPGKPDAGITPTSKRLRHRLPK